MANTNNAPIVKRILATIAVATVLVIAAPGRVAAEDVAFVVNKANPTDTLSMAQLKKILLAKDAQWPNGKKITIYMGAPGQPERSSALKIACGMSETDFYLQYMHAAFVGETAEPPKVAASAAQAKQAVAAAPGAMAVIRASEVDDTVKVVKIDGVAPGGAGYPVPIK